MMATIGRNSLSLNPFYDGSVTIDRSQLAEDWANVNATTFVMLDPDLGPVLNFQARNSGELRHVVCYENKSMAKTDGSNL